MDEDEQRGVRRLVVLLSAGVGVLALVSVGIAWYFADQLTLPPTVRPFEPDNELLAVDGDTVTLRAEGHAALDGRWGLQLPDDRHVVLTERLGAADGSDNGEVRWRFTDVVGAPPEPGEPVRVDEFVWVGTPDARGLPFEAVEVDGPLGALPTWWVPATGEPVGTVVFVHGRGGTREEALRFLPAMVESGWNVLVQRYRGDTGAPGWPDGRVRFGSTEWADAEAAVAHVGNRDDAGEQVVLFGVSMGGSLAAQLLDRSALADRVDGVVLDSPLLSMDALLDLQADLNGIPEAAEPVLLPLVQLFADWRFDLDSAALEQVATDGTFQLPMLLVHGEEDAFVPDAGSVAFAAARRDGDPQVTEVDALRVERLDGLTWVRAGDVGHARSWNLAPDAYDQLLRRFLTEVADG